MSILQDPLAALRQAEWYLDHASDELFPGAFELAAGNLCRQTVEQALLIVCCFSGMPQTRYVRPGGRLRAAGALIEELRKTEQTSGKSYWVRAARCGSRIGKFVRVRRTIAKWARILNEPSHFSVRNRRLCDAELRQFVAIAHGWFDDKDKNTLVAILNQVVSQGRYTAVLGPEPDNLPGIHQRVVVTAADLKRTPEGAVTLRVEIPHVIVSKRHAPRGRWPRVPVLIERTGDISIGFQLVTKRGKPVKTGTLEDVFRSLASTKGERAYLVRRMKELGLMYSFSGVLASGADRVRDTSPDGCE